ncbi:hypothetical protein HZR84_13930 [Hyphobacterium sp. CCMP332]|nr:hypothetical protein HZR84_13930 [Hyphobacterium sp. CCMP332]
MLKNRILPLSILIILLVSNLLSAQNQKYSIFWGDDEIGLMNVSRIQKGIKTEYSFKADVEFRVILKYNRSTQFNATYLRDTLIYCSSKSVMNDNLKDFQYTKKIGDSYQIFQHPDDTLKMKECILQSVALLYFNEPKPEMKRIYAEGYSKFVPIEKVGNGIYKLYLTEDKTNVYHYTNGQLNEVKVLRTWFDLTFKRQFN